MCIRDRSHSTHPHCQSLLINLQLFIVLVFTFYYMLRVCEHVCTNSLVTCVLRVICFWVFVLITCPHTCLLIFQCNCVICAGSLNVHCCFLFPPLYNFHPHKCNFSAKIKTKVISITPVSYTHLDVYKRQLLYNTDRITTVLVVKEFFIAHFHTVH